MQQISHLTQWSNLSLSSLLGRSIVALVLALLASSCAEPDCLYYQVVQLESEVISSSETIKTINTDLTVVPLDQSYPGERDQLEIKLESGARIYIDSVLFHVVNGRAMAQSDGTHFATSRIYCYDTTGIHYWRTPPNDQTFSVENPLLVGNIHDDSVDPDFESVSILHVRLDDNNFLTKCGLDQPFELSLRFKTNASMVTDRAAPSIHGCKER